ncbi:MAG: putative adenylylsulfate reductase-associated electron transfer protein QmoC [Ignavibacteria bacterium]|nr:putative adenylylsulfate reductase-associated electron transfer protein QmoC [Ignavibacteria bacterium]
MELNPDIEFIRQLKKYGGNDLKKCFQCATCSVVCNLSPEENAFPRKEMLWANWGLKEKLVKDIDVWLCHYCNDCTAQCPRGAKPGNVMSAIRYSVIEEYAIPKFLTRVYSNPKFLVLLILIPLALFSLFFYNNIGGDFSQLHQGTIVFAQFFPHSYLEIFWIGGNIIIFGLAAFSLLKYNSEVRQHYKQKPESGFLQALILTIQEIILHKKFADCDAKSSRKIAHLLVLFGFFGAMATAGLALIADIVFGMPAPIPFFHPIKILGNLSGIAILTGCTIFVVRRLTNKDNNLKSTYIDWSFLLFLYLVGITGLSTQFTRIAQIPELAYGIYILHLTAIFILLWFVMYSKFAHIFYRTLSMIIAKQYGRNQKKSYDNLNLKVNI